MSSTFSSSWYRVSTLKPQLRNHIEIHRQPYGDENLYLLQDHTTGKLYRFNSAAYEMIGRMDGIRTVHDIWEMTLVASGDDAPTQDEVIGILSRLHSADALQGSISPDCLELFRRGEQQQRKQWLQKFRSPMSIKVPLFDPDKLLEVITPVVGFIFTKTGFFIWLSVLILAMVWVFPEWSSLLEYASINALETNNLIVLGVIYPLVKALHELGHGITTKKWGGEVHEMGISFLVFVPVPYVDASSSAVCRNKYHRMAISAAGMMVEVFLASLAVFVWMYVEDGLVRSIAFNVILIAGVSTLVFNGNPLLRFDAYYILEDYIEVPSLASRSTRYLTYLIQRYLFGVTAAVSPVGRSGEKGWLFFYGIASTVYKWFITITIIWFVAGEFFIFGILLAVWAIISQIILPIWKVISFLLFDPKLQSRRLISLSVSSVAMAGVFYIVCMVPIPSVSLVDGVLFPPEDAKIISTGEGFVKEINVKPFEMVKPGQILYELDTPFTRSEVAVLKSEYNELEVRYRIAKASDMFEANLVQEKLTAKAAELKQNQDKLENLKVSSTVEGQYVPLDFWSRRNTFIKKGELLGYIVGNNTMTVQVAIPQSKIGIIREGVKDVSVRFVNDMSRSYQGKIARAVPAAQNTLQSKVLGKAGGGKITVNPSDEEGLTTLDSVFHYEIALDEPISQAPIGLRAHVRFNHGDETIAMQCYRIARQLFLGRFGV